MMTATIFYRTTGKIPVYLLLCLLSMVFLSATERPGNAHAQGTSPYRAFYPDIKTVSTETLAGAIPDSTHTSGMIELRPGGTLILYTDGVNEAMDNEKNLYSDERLIDQIDPEVGRHPKQIVDVIEQSVYDFATGAEQSDDITVLCPKFNEISKN
jgi:hypothetical protein